MLRALSFMPDGTLLKVVVPAPVALLITGELPVKVLK